MGWQAFVASLVQSLAWPAGVVAVVVVLRKPIRAVLSQALLRRVKAGPLEMEFDQVQAEVQLDLARSPELANASPVPAPVGSLSEVLATLAETSPKTAVIAAYQRIEDRLTEILKSADALSLNWTRVRGLAKIASERGLISEEARGAIEGLSMLRDLSVQSGLDIGADRAREYLVMADAVLYALRPKASS